MPPYAARVDSAGAAATMRSRGWSAHQQPLAAAATARDVRGAVPRVAEMRIRPHQVTCRRWDDWVVVIHTRWRAHAYPAGAERATWPSRMRITHEYTNIPPQRTIRVFVARNASAYPRWPRLNRKPPAQKGESRILRAIDRYHPIRRRHPRCNSTSLRMSLSVGLMIVLTLAAALQAQLQSDTDLLPTAKLAAQPRPTRSRLQTTTPTSDRHARRPEQVDDRQAASGSPR